MLWRAWPFLGGWASSLRARIVATASTTTTSMMLLWMEEAASDCYGHTKRGRAEAFNVATYVLLPTAVDDQNRSCHAQWPTARGGRSRVPFVDFCY